MPVLEKTKCDNDEKKFVEVPEGKPLHVSISFPLDSHNTAKTTLKLPQTNNLERNHRAQNYYSYCYS